MSYENQEKKQQSQNINQEQKTSTSPVHQRYTDNRPETQSTAQLHAAIRAQTIANRPSYMSAPNPPAQRQVHPMFQNRGTSSVQRKKQASSDFHIQMAKDEMAKAPVTQRFEIPAVSENENSLQMKSEIIQKKPVNISTTKETDIVGLQNGSIYTSDISKSITADTNLEIETDDSIWSRRGSEWKEDGAEKKQSNHWYKVNKKVEEDISQKNYYFLDDYQKYQVLDRPVIDKQMREKYDAPLNEIIKNGDDREKNSARPKTIKGMKDDDANSKKSANEAILHDSLAKALGNISALTAFYIKKEDEDGKKDAINYAKDAEENAKRAIGKKKQSDKKNDRLNQNLGQFFELYCEDFIKTKHPSSTIYTGLKVGNAEVDFVIIEGDDVLLYSIKLNQEKAKEKQDMKLWNSILFGKAKEEDKTNEMIKQRWDDGIISGECIQGTRPKTLPNVKKPEWTVLGLQNFGFTNETFAEEIFKDSGSL
jgi:hypothetical protein